MTKSFPPSVKKLRQARLDGKVAKSRILTEMAGIFALWALLASAQPKIWVGIRILLECCWSASPPEIRKIWGICTLALLKFTVCCLILKASTGLLIELLQFGWLCNFKLAKPSCGRMSLSSFVKRISSAYSSLGLLAARAFGAALILIFLCRIFSIASFSVAAFDAETGGINPEVFGAVRSLWFSFCCLGLSIGLIEYRCRSKSLRRELSMSFPELQRELKEEEGDPLLKSARKSMHEALVMQEMIARVRRSRVVVVERS
jgi:type III secretion protein U